MNGHTTSRFGLLIVGLVATVAVALMTTWYVKCDVPRADIYGTSRPINDIELNESSIDAEINSLDAEASTLEAELDAALDEIDAELEASLTE